jgi:hypothetical protein
LSLGKGNLGKILRSELFRGEEGKLVQLFIVALSNSVVVIFYFSLVLLKHFKSVSHLIVFKGDTNFFSPFFKKLVLLLPMLLNSVENASNGCSTDDSPSIH